MLRIIREKPKIILVLLLACVLCAGLASCYSPSTKKQTTNQHSTTSAKSTPVKKTYSDIPTPFPNLYRFDPESGLKNVYDESKVISWEEAGDHVGQAVTVEGDVVSIVHAASSNGSPYFFNLGGEAYEGFAVVIWSDDLARFDQYALRDDVAWSMSDQPLNMRLRVSGVVEMYNGRPQITARDGTQVAQWVNNGWYSLISDNTMDALMDSLYR